MSWENKSKLSHQEVAEQVLQIYTRSLQDQKTLKGVLSEFSVLDYFGKYFYGQDKVSSQLISNLHGSSYELSSLSTNDQPYAIEWDPESETQEKFEEDLGVSLISPPKLTFPSLSFSTPVRSYSQLRKKKAVESTFDHYNGNKKLCKRESNGENSSSTQPKDKDNMKQSMSLSPQAFQTMFPSDIKYLTAYGTIRYPKRALPTMDPKRIKRHGLGMLRDRFCQLYIGFECDEHATSITNCKIWTIKYSVSSRVTPRNLLKLFNEVEKNGS